MRFSHWIYVHFEGDEIPFQGLYDKQNLSLVVVSYEIYETRWKLVL